MCPEYRRKYDNHKYGNCANYDAMMGLSRGVIT